MESDHFTPELANARGRHGIKLKDSAPPRNRHGACFQWVEFSVFVALSAAIYASTVVHSLYGTVFAGDESNPALISDVVIFWAIWARTVVLFVPLLAVVALSMFLGLRRAAWTIGFSGWAVLAFLLTVDLILVTVNGTHLADWLPYLHDVLQAPERNQVQYVGSGIGVEALKIVAALVVGGSGLMALIRWVGRWVHRRFMWLDSFQSAATGGLCILILAAGSVPALSSLNSPALVPRLNLILPVDMTFLEDFYNDAGQVIGKAHEVFKDPSSQALPRAGTSPRLNSASSQTSRLVFHNRMPEDVDLANYFLLGKGGVRLPLQGKLPKGGQTSLTLPADQASPDEFFLVDRNGRVTHRLTMQQDLTVIRLVLSNEGRIPDSLVASVNRGLTTVRDRYLEDALDPKSVDPEAVVRKDSLPNVIIIALESFRYTAISPDLTKRLWEWSTGGLRLERHYSASNCSHLSLFSLLYGRNGLGYAATLDRQILPQLCTSLRGSGYKCSFVTSTECRQFQRMHEYLNESSFDRVEWLGPGSWEDFRAWPDADRRAFAEIRKIASTQSEQPQFIFAFLVSSHYPYISPKEFEIHKPCGDQVRLESVMRHRSLTKEILVNRYRNSISFLENELMKLIEALDPQRNLIVVTGDHGESIGEDGVLSHNSRASEIQTRVPFIMVGPGIDPHRITMPTSHMDVLPTLMHALAGQTVPIRNCHGRDLLADEVEDTGIAITPLIGRDVVIVRDNERLLFKANLKPGTPPSVAFQGLIDEKGLPQALARSRSGRLH
jgi:hypothetical protein